jgi:hypothetical protein
LQANHENASVIAAGGEDKSRAGAANRGRREYGELQFALGLFQAGDAVAFFPLAALFEQGDAFKAFQYVALGARHTGRSETAML